MSSTQKAPGVADATDDDFDAVVIEGSQAVPVLVDFWAPWCGPCRTIGPILERLAEEMGDRLKVVKVNVDDNPITSARFGVQGIPAVKLWAGGDKVGEFVGALPESQIREFLEQHLPSASGEAAREAALCLSNKDYGAARDLASKALDLQPSVKTRALADLVLAKVAVATGDFAAAEQHVLAIPGSADQWNEGQSILASVALAQVAVARGTAEEVAERVSSGDPASMEDCFADAIFAMLGGDYPAALERLLVLVERDKRWNDEAARKAMLTVFDLAGTRSELSDGFRRRLSLLL